MKKNQFKKIKGFTLVELLVVIAIIGILVSVGVVNYNKAQITARDAKRISDMESVATAMELYYSQNKKYLECPLSDNRGNFRNLVKQLQIGGYLASTPVDPTDNSSYFYGCKNYTERNSVPLWNGNYTEIYTKLENKNETPSIGTYPYVEWHIYLGSGTIKATNYDNNIYYRAFFKRSNSI